MSSTWTDTQTSLMWTLLPESYSQKNAQNTCAQLRMDGHADWRLPNLGELKSLLKVGASRPIVGLSKGSEFYWTGTAFDTDQYSFYGVNPQGQQDDFAASSAQAVLAVRTILDVDTGVWTDPKTGLMWARVSIGQRWENGQALGDAREIKLSDAQEACSKYRLAGFKDWRLPTIEELKSIVLDGHIGTSAPNGMLLPPNASGGWEGDLYLSSTTKLYPGVLPWSQTNHFLCVDFQCGQGREIFADMGGRIRTVR